MDFPKLLEQFTTAVTENDPEGLANLFTEDGVYIDGFYGPFKGREEIAQMLKVHFWGDAKDFKWTMTNPALQGDTAYATYLFTYTSTNPQSTGKKVLFEGMSRFQLEGVHIKEYKEVFDRGTALAQLEFPKTRIAKSLKRWANELVESDRGECFLKEQ